MTIEKTLNLNNLSQYELIYHASESIVNDELSNNNSIKNALAAISIVSLENRIRDLYQDTDILPIDRRVISKVLKRKLNVADYGENIEALRKIIADTLFPSNNIQSFNQTDLSSGFTHPGRISFPIAYLLGVYRTDIFFVEDNKVRLSGKTDDEKFYKNIVQPLIKKVFSMNIDFDPIPRHKNGYEWTDVKLEFSSKEHINYLKRIGFIDDKLKFKDMDFESVIGIDKSRIRLYKEAYLMGMIAGAGNITERKMKFKTCSKIDTQLHFKNEKMDYLPEMIRILSELNIYAEYINPPSKPHFIYFNQENFRIFARYTPHVLITDSQIGFFTNPKHINNVREIRYS